jgi:molybdate transport system substrate-binding protein
MARSRIRSAAVVLAVALSAAACGGNEPSSGGASGGGAPAASPTEIKTEIKVFAAASLTAAFNKIGEQFTAANPDIKVAFNFAGSQALATQIQQGAPADAFASADTTNMGKVASLVSDPQVFTGNTLQIIVGRGNPKGVHGLSDLANPDLKVVLAAPEVPAGKYAEQILDAQKVTVKPVSLEDNVKAVVTKVSLGEADAGIVYVTDVTAGGDTVEGVDIPADQNVPATYPIAVVTASTHQAEAKAFVDYVRGADGQLVLKAFGFLPPAS